jgi:2-dehydropantoate 2-reductase
VSAPSIAILGPGAVGGLLTVLLTRTGVDVTIIARKSTAERIARDGIELRSERFGDGVTQPAEVVERLEDSVGVLLIATKATSLEDALKRIDAPVKVIVPLLNGVEHVALLRERLQWDVAAASIRVQVRQLAPGVIEHFAPFVRVALTSEDPALQQPLEALAATLDTAGVDVKTGGGELDLLWGKLARLAPLALSTAAIDQTLGVVRADPQRRALLDAAIDEVVAVANAQGTALDPAQVRRELDALADDASSSLRGDVGAGSPHELDAIAGAVLRAGARDSVACPAVASLAGEVLVRARSVSG